MIRFLLPGLMLLFATLACNFPQAKIPLTATPATDPTPTERYSACGWMWANQDQPELSRELASHLEASGLMEVSVSASAFGENCLNEQGIVEYFVAMQTDFYFTIPVDTLDDTAGMGSLAGTVLMALDSFPQDNLPGNGPGQVQLHFTDTGGEEIFLWFAYRDWIAAREAGLTGAALLEKLQGK